MQARELAAEAAQADALFNAFPDPIARYDHAHRHLFLNEAMERITALSRAQMLGKTPSESGMSEPQLTGWSLLLERVFAGGQSVEDLISLEVGSRLRSFHVRALPERDAAGNIATAVVIARDVTESEMYRAARADADRLQRIQALTAAFSLAPTPEDVAGVLATQLHAALDAESVRVVLVDPRTHTLGLAASVGEGDHAIDEVVEDVVRTGEPRFEVAGADDTTVASVPLAHGGESVGAVLVSLQRPNAFDEPSRAFVLTVAQHTAQAVERAQLLRAEREARIDAEAANRLKDEFVATMSHELRTPLNAVIGWTTILSADPANNEMARRGLRAIERNARAQARLVEDVLDVSRIVSGKLKLDRSVVDVGAIAIDAMDVVRDAAEAKRIALHIDADRPCSLLADARRIQQVVWNLVSNAVKFTREEGRVEVTIRRAPHGVELVVTDDGAGIPLDFLPFVFERFRQLDGSSTRSAGGLGLGLAIVRHLVELHGGTVTAASDGLGHGSRFTVVLHGEPTGDAVTSSAGSMRIPPSPSSSRD